MDRLISILIVCVQSTDVATLALPELVDGERELTAWDRPGQKQPG
jgi:hypothetical protein